MDLSLTPDFLRVPSANADGTDLVLLKRTQFSAMAADLSCPAVLFERPVVRCAKLSQTILATTRKHPRRPAKEPGYRRLPASLPDVILAARPEERQRSPQRLLLLS